MALCGFCMNDQRTKRRDVHHPLADGTVIPKLCLSCEARHRGICGALTAPELVTLSKSAVKKTLHPGETVVGDSRDVLSYSNILSGVAKLSKTLPDGRQQIVGLQFAPDFLGRPFQKESHIDIEAATDISLCTFSRASVERMLNDSSEFKQRLFDQTLEQLDEARDWMVTLGRKTAREKVASFLLLVARHADPEQQLEDDGPININLPLTRADMADFLGLTIETVSRQLTALRKAGIITLLDQRLVSIPEIERLKAASGDD